MSDATPEATTEATEAPEANTNTEATSTETDWKAEARKWEARAKENTGAAQKLREIEDANKSELQRAQELAEASRREVESLRLESLRMKVATKYKLDESDIELFLTGTDEAVLNKQAERLASKATTTETKQETPRAGFGLDVSSREDSKDAVDRDSAARSLFGI